MEKNSHEKLPNRHQKMPITRGDCENLANWLKTLRQFLIRINRHIPSTSAILSISTTYYDDAEYWRKVLLFQPRKKEKGRLGRCASCGAHTRFWCKTYNWHICKDCDSQETADRIEDHIMNPNKGLSTEFKPDVEDKPVERIARDKDAVKCRVCSGYAELVEDPTSEETKRYGCNNIHDCCSRIFECCLCGNRMGFKAESPEME